MSSSRDSRDYKSSMKFKTTLLLVKLAPVTFHCKTNFLSCYVFIKFMANVLSFGCYGFFTLLDSDSQFRLPIPIGLYDTTLIGIHCNLLGSRIHSLYRNQSLLWWLNYIAGLGYGLWFLYCGEIGEWGSQSKLCEHFLLGTMYQYTSIWSRLCCTWVLDCYLITFFCHSRLKELLRTRLIECGWRDQLKAYCKGTRWTEISYD